MILYCVRHGESTYNAEGRVQGQSDVPLSERGRRQGEAVAAAMAHLPIDAIYSSPLRRALETARVVAEPLGLEVQTDPRLMEVNAGIFQDKLRSDLERLHPEDFARWTSGDTDFVIPGGESRRVLARRGLEALEAIRRTDHQHVAVVAHGRLLVVTFQALMKFPADVALQNGSITRISFDGNARAELLSPNEVDHLSNVGLGGEGDL
ncbi:MAG: histidine phosphatase family protein [Planctomycetota bacterium]